MCVISLALKMRYKIILLTYLVIYNLLLVC